MPTSGHLSETDLGSVTNGKSGDGIYVIGAGGHAKVVMSTVVASGKRVNGLFDDSSKMAGLTVGGEQVLGPTRDALELDRGSFIIGVGDNKTRKDLATRLSILHWVTTIHPHCWVDSSAFLDDGTVVFAGAIIQPGARIGKHCIINTSATVDHDCILGDYVHIGPGVHLAGGVTIEEGAFLGVAASAIPGTNIGAWAQIGAGGVVTTDIRSFAVAVGAPAQQIKRGPANP